ncbi:MAG: gamma carbonic anhydrase family protein [bacterium]|nr:gamma carbonic anhydrase family protein [bacterium]
MLIPFEGKMPKVHETAWIAETAVLIGDVEIGEESGIWYGCVLRGDEMPVRIGKRSNVQDGSILHVENGLHPCILGDDVSVGHGAIVHGCEVGDGALIAMGAIIMNNVKVGEGAVVAAGAVVTEGKVVEPGTLWMGTPARYVRDVNDEERERFGKTPVVYSHLKDRYRNG